MRWYKGIVVIVGFATMLTITNCFATVLPTNEMKITKDNIEYIYRDYEVPESQDGDFFNSIEKELKIDNKQYVLENSNKIGGNVLEQIDINTDKTIKTDTNKLEDILSQLSEEIEYNEDGYIGKYIIDMNSIKIENVYNGYTEYLVEEYKNYIGLPTNDLVNIPKQVVKNGMKLDLLKTDWEITKTRLIGENEVPSEFTAHCYYANKKRVDNPLSYTVTASYSGNAKKIIENPFVYTVIYKEIPQKAINYLPFLAGASGGIFIVLLGFIFRKNTKIYNLQDGNWKLIHKAYIRKPLLKLDNCTYKSKTNKYKIEFSKSILNKLNGKMLTISKGKKTVSRLINKDNNLDPFVLEISV